MDAGSDERTVITELGEEECLALVGEEGVGRIGFVEEGEIYVYPVNYVRDHRGVAFRTDTDSHLYKASTSSVAFEVDVSDELTRTGWSVLIRGTARLATDAVDLPSRDFFRHGVEPWMPGKLAEWIRISHPVVSGRRVGPVAAR